jgi:hypothetical protein
VLTVSNLAQCLTIERTQETLKEYRSFSFDSRFASIQDSSYRRYTYISCVGISVEDKETRVIVRQTLAYISTLFGNIRHPPLVTFTSFIV